MNTPSRSCLISASFLLGTVLAIAAETPPRLSMTVSDQQATLSLEGAAATAYEIQYADALSGPFQWHSLTNLVLGDESVVIPHPRGTQARRFFRAVVIAREPVIPEAANWVWIRPGSFWMGSPATEAGRRADEGPQTHVTITRGFYLGKCEVRQSEFVAVMGYNPSKHVGDLNRPVENLNYLEAAEYCRRLTVRERTEGRLPDGWAYRLPTEAEWEYACRAGTSTRFSFGDDPTYVLLRSFEWCAANSNQKPRPVGTKEPNPWGLYDMQGNVRERFALCHLRTRSVRRSCQKAADRVHGRGRGRFAGVYGPSARAAGPAVLSSARAVNVVSVSVSPWALCLCG